MCRLFLFFWTWTSTRKTVVSLHRIRLSWDSFEVLLFNNRSRTYTYNRTTNNSTTPTTAKTLDFETTTEAILTTPLQQRSEFMICAVWIRNDLMYNSVIRNAVYLPKNWTKLSPSGQYCPDIIDFSLCGLPRLS